jgi:hypothetical protein
MFKAKKTEQIIKLYTYLSVKDRKRCPFKKVHSGWGGGGEEIGLKSISNSREISRQVGKIYLNITIPNMYSYLLDWDFQKQQQTREEEEKTMAERKKVFFLLYSDTLGQVTRLIHIIPTQ